MPITSLNQNDVLIGRGTGPNSYIGNKRFRQHVDTRRKEYQGVKCVSEKARIAKEVVDHIHSLGGRFVIQIHKGRKVGDLLLDGEWREEENDVAVEKAKRSLRDKKGPITAERHEKKEGDTTINERTPLAVAPMFLANTQYPAVDARLLLFQSGFGLLPPQTYLATSSALQLGHLSPLMNVASSGISQKALLEQYVAATRYQQGDVGLCSPSPEPLHEMSPSKKHQRTEDSKVAPDAENAMDGGIHEENSTENTPFPNEPYSVSETSKEDEAAAFVLSSLAIKDRPVITYEQMEQEKAAMSDEHRASALADMFGDLNIGSDAAPSSKKGKRELDLDSIGFLIRRMRFHIERIPESNKQALIEAQAKCKSEEFSDARLEKFLRCEGMNTDLAAQRFVGYWEKRKEAFGKDKFTLPLTLSEALRDDIAALEVAVYSLLPRRDLSGRQIMYLVPPHNTGVGYSHDSLFRAMWYVAEVAAAQNTDARSGVVEVTWHKECSLWDYNPSVYDRLIVGLQCYWPIRNIAAHVCCPPKIFARWLFPVLNALTDPCMWARVQVHDVPPSEIVNTLSVYGIQKEMLPTEMGGELEVNPSEWIAERRAAEMEEL